MDDKQKQRSENGDGEGKWKEKMESVDWTTWTKLHAGIDFPREIDWMEIRRFFGGGIMAVGMD